MRITRGTPVTIVLVGIAVGLLGLQGANAVRDRERPPAARNDAGLALGVTTLSLARNGTNPWHPSDLNREVNAFERAAERRTSVVSWFADLSGTGFQASQARAVAQRGAIPEITLEPWNAARIGRRQPEWSLRTIVAGKHDAALTAWANGAAAYGKPIRLRFAHEMNGTSYPCAIGGNGNTAAQFVAAWIHVHKLFGRAGATNVAWVWAPVTGKVNAELYPGDAWVDRLGLSGFNGGTKLFKRGWRTFDAAFAEPLDELHALAPTLPVELSEVASAEEGGSKPQWIHELFAGLRARPWIDTVVWFHLRKETDWRINSSEASRAAFAAEAAKLDQP